MTRQDVLNALSEIGEEHGADYHDGLQGYFSWKIQARNGDFEITVTFSDMSDVDEIVDAPVYEYTWTLSPSEVSEGGRRKRNH